MGVEKQGGRIKERRKDLGEKGGSIRVGRIKERRDYHG